jgi:hypothetical protein
VMVLQRSNRRHNRAPFGQVLISVQGSMQPAS